jgi:hypothetical protein
MLNACSYTICLVFCYTLWHFFAFSGANLLTRCHSVSSLFSAIFVFQKSYTGNILGPPNIYRSCQKTKEETERSQGPASPPGGTAQPLAALPYGEGALVHLWSCPFTYKDPPTGKTERPDQFSRNTSRSAAVVDPRSGGSKSSSWHPARKGNRH